MRGPAGERFEIEARSRTEEHCQKAASSQVSSSETTSLMQRPDLQNNLRKNIILLFFQDSLSFFPNLASGLLTLLILPFHW